MLKTMQAQRENQEKTMDLQSMQDTSQFDLVEKLRDVEALLDPETQTVTLVSVQADGQKARKIKTQIRLINADGSKLDTSQNASLFIGNVFDKSLSVIKATSQPQSRPSDTSASPSSPNYAMVDTKQADTSLLGLDGNMMMSGTQHQNLDNSLLGLGGNMMAH